ncbi:hypothetical protein K435DRAFT_657227, partial [Dendrothele bispora CBS 962.96]
MGRPFDVLVESEVKNTKQGDQYITLTDPNSSRRQQIGTYSRRDGELVEEQGEVAVSLEMDENGEIKMLGYKLPDEKVFGTDELNEAYLMASKDSIAEHDKEAAASSFSNSDTAYTEQSPPDTPNAEIRKDESTRKSTKRYKLVRVYGSRKYKPVGVKVRPVKTQVPPEFHIKRDIKGDPLADMPELPTHPPEFVLPGERYTEERKKII